MKKYVKFFLNPIEGRERFLNDKASEGLKLEESGSFVHKFTESDNPSLHYSVQYIGNTDSKESRDYIDFVRNLDYRVSFAPFNIGKFAIGNVRLRPYNKGRSSIATSPGIINHEIMIIESNGDNQIPVFTDSESKSEALFQRKAPYKYIFLASLILIILGLTQSQGSLIERTIFSFRPLEKYPWVWTLAGCVLLTVSLVSLYQLNLITKKNNDEQ